MSDEVPMITIPKQRYGELCYTEMRWNGNKRLIKPSRLDFDRAIEALIRRSLAQPTRRMEDGRVCAQFLLARWDWYEYPMNPSEAKRLSWDMFDHTLTVDRFLHPASREFRKLVSEQKMARVLRRWGKKLSYRVL